MKKQAAAPGLNKNRSPLTIILTALILLLCLFLVILLTAVCLVPPQYEDTFLGEMKYKMKRLTETQGKRIIVIGGSSVPFSVKSRLLEESFPGYSIVDFGLYADMGTTVMLDWAQEELRCGDIVIISPEQNEQALSCYFSGEDIWQASDGCLGLIPRLTYRRYEKLAASLPIFAGKKIYYALTNSPQPEGVYARASFNEYGDIDCAGREYNIMSQGYDPNHRISFSREIISDEFLEEINSFAGEAAAKGAQVYYRFAPMNELALEEGASRQSIDSYYDALMEALTFPILGDPHTCILESGWFYDTNFHLNDSGTVVFTKGMIEDLKVAFGDTSPTALNLPAMPRAPGAAIDGDSSCADCFTYIRNGEGWAIDGLTDKGASSASLIIPTTFEGEPVTGMAETLFHGNPALRELTIQPNIGTLIDGMFSGCSSFEKLLLTGEPADYVVGGSLTDGADFQIYVPAEAIDAFRRHYSWQKYDSLFVPATQPDN